jgi:hypothetical protein
MASLGSTAQASRFLQQVPGLDLEVPVHELGRELAWGHVEHIAPCFLRSRTTRSRKLDELGGGRAHVEVAVVGGGGGLRVEERVDVGVAERDEEREVAGEQAARERTRALPATSSTTCVKSTTSVRLRTRTRALEGRLVVRLDELRDAGCIRPARSGAPPWSRPPQGAYERTVVAKVRRPTLSPAFEATWASMRVALSA